MCGDAFGYLCDPCFYKVTREGAEEICEECKKSAEEYFADEIAELKEMQEAQSRDIDIDEANWKDHLATCNGCPLCTGKQSENR